LRGWTNRLRTRLWPGSIKSFSCTTSTSPALVGQGVIGGPALLGQESGGLDAEQAGRREGY
jgi:hypothetical protein